MAQKLIAYYRVSTARQGLSGLGLEGQVAAVAEYAKATGGSAPAGLYGGRKRQAQRPAGAGQGLG